MAIVKTLIVKGVARFLTDAYMSTIRSGIWNGSTIQVGYGGTGVTSAKGNLYTPVFLASNGITPCSVEIPHATKAFKINGVTFDVFTNSTGAAPTIFAPTTLAGTGGYILATNSAKTGLEWVAKPATNVTTTAVVAAAADGTTQISAAQSNPYYNLLEGGAVTRSIQFKSSNITISSTTGGVISFTAASWAGATSEAAGTAGYMPGAAVADRTKFLRGDGSWINLSLEDHTHSVIINGSIKTIAAPGGTAVNLGNYTNLYTYSLTSKKGVRISYSSGVPVLVSVHATNGGSKLILIGHGYGAQGWVRNLWRAILSGGAFKWSLPNSTSINTSVEIFNDNDSAVATVHVWTSGGISFTLIDALTTAAVTNQTLLTASMVSNSAATIGTTDTTIATIGGVAITAKIPDVTAQAIELASVSKTLAVSTWTDMATVNTYSGTYAIQISDGTLYASGTFSVCGGTDVIIDEIPLHVSSTGATWRPYARISAGQLQMTTNEATGTARTYTIKILKLI